MPGTPSSLYPMRWPSCWSSQELDLIRETPLNCLIVEDQVAPPAGTYSILTGLDARQLPGVVLVEGLWPRARLGRQRNQADAGPTGQPWIDSNGWRIRLARARQPGKPIWLVADPPEKDVLPPEAVLTPIAEAAAHGAHWVVSLPQDFAQQLARRDPQALRVWERARRLLGFFQERQAWARWVPLARLGVVSSFAGESEFLSQEFLNLAARRNLAYRIATTGEVSPEALAGLRAVIYIEPEPPQGALATQLYGFAQKGGLLILPALPPGIGPQEQRHSHWLARYGTGRLAAPVEPWSDPYLLAEQVHWLVGRRYDPVRLWNGDLLGALCCREPDGERLVVHLVGYAASRPFRDVTLGIAGNYRTARFWSLDGEGERPCSRAKLGVEVALEPFSVYCAVELLGGGPNV